MTERNLSNGWFEAKRVRQFLFLLLLLNIVVWALDAAAYRNRLEAASTTVKYMHLYDSEELFTVYDIVKGQVDVLGVVCMAFGMLCTAVVTVHRESFTENWHVTLRRIPNYRGKYLGSKLCAVLVPGGVYMVYTLTQGLFRWLMYEGDDTVRLFENTKTTMGDFLSFGPWWELVLLIVLAAQAMLLGSLTVRNIKKDVPGFLAALVGMVSAVLWFTEQEFVSEPWIFPIILSVANGMVAIFLVRHGFQKL
ncbi:MAG: hypothetical protein IJW37_05560 [Lachnospiraceae bacterium]|nr:hypothetical protein [Lachnospiraceae bacterium]